MYKKVNAGRCPDCGDIVLSLHVHHFDQCKCGSHFTDGGFEYMHRTVGLIDIPNLYVKVTNTTHASH